MSRKSRTIHQAQDGHTSSRLKDALGLLQIDARLLGQLLAAERLIHHLLHLGIMDGAPDKMPPAFNDSQGREQNQTGS